MSYVYADIDSVVIARLEREKAEVTRQLSITRIKNRKLLESNKVLVEELREAADLLSKMQATGNAENYRAIADANEVK